ncbi:hypothetical protein GE183_18045 [Acinetobacter baumannii]|nr:hypothetical protein [Acinetobacter baumannii]
MKKATKEDFLKSASSIHNNYYNYDLVEYVNKLTKVKIICPRHGEFEQLPKTHLKGQGCIKCGYEKAKLLNRTPIKDLLIEFNKVHNGKYQYDFKNYKSNKSKINIVCPEHGIFEQAVASHLKGHGCARCSGRALPSKDEIIQELYKTHHRKYSYEDLEVKGAKGKISINCPTHGPFKQSLYDHRTGHGCPKCKIENLKGVNALSLTQAIEAFKSKHGDTYCYDRVVYINNRTKIIIVCKTHGEFLQTPNDHQQGAGCPQCKIELISSIKRKGVSDLIETFKSIHKDTYDYSLINNYNNNKQKLKIICKQHGIFLQSANWHLRGVGCPVCGRQLSTIKKGDYIQLCNKYDGFSHIYIIRCHNHEESFYKIGIARRGVKDRYKDKARFPYEYEIIFEKKGKAQVVWDIEKNLHFSLRNMHYKPKLYFKGCKNECFSSLSEDVFVMLDSVKVA